MLNSQKKNIYKAYLEIKNSFNNGNKLLVCGNGGSAADAEHFVGELMKSFIKKRPLNEGLMERFKKVAPENWEPIWGELETPLPAISLVSQSSLISAIGNDISFDYIFAQQVLGYGKKGDILFTISTSAASSNIQNALIVGKVMGMTTICLTGNNYNSLIDPYCDVIISVEGNSTPEIQELHLPIYHTISASLEEELC
ncbi:D-sedoheptulose-7-phosphate isomerase [Cytobacillus praedii]|uniref:D-sedoheptulose-7-phosphate isomerase n=1 Tax=Cytobacillus praedii TaxID=1742358 RepID=UPI003F800434